MTDHKRLPTTMGGDRMIGDEELLDDVEGHGFGHRKGPSATGDDDVEGHKFHTKPS